MISTPLPHFWTSHTRQLSPKRNGKKPMVLPEESPTASRLTRKPPWEKPPRAAGDRPRCLSNLLEALGWAEKVLRGTRNKSGKQVQQIIICQIAGKQVAWKNVRINFEIDDSLSLCQTSPSFCPAAPCISATCGETVQSATRPFSVHVEWRGCCECEFRGFGAVKNTENSKRWKLKGDKNKMWRPQIFFLPSSVLVKQLKIDICFA